MTSACQSCLHLKPSLVNMNYSWKQKAKIHLEKQHCLATRTRNRFIFCSMHGVKVDRRIFNGPYFRVGPSLCSLLDSRFQCRHATLLPTKWGGKKNRKQLCSRLQPLLQSESKCKAIDKKMSFHYRANKTRVTTEIPLILQTAPGEIKIK